MSSNDGDDDDLEERKGDLWSMDEVRGSGTATTDTEDTSENEAASTTSDTAEPTDTSDISDTEVTKDTADTSGEESSSTMPDAKDTDDFSAEADGETVRQMALDADAKGIAVRDLHNVNVYLYESVYREMRVKYKELDTEYFAAHGEDLSKNKDFFNAVFRAGLQSPQLKEELEID
jgi:hypothetical protein